VHPLLSGKGQCLVKPLLPPSHGGEASAVVSGAIKIFGNLRIGSPAKQARGPHGQASYPSVTPQTMNVLQPSGQMAHSNPLTASYVMVPPANQIPLQGPAGRNTHHGNVQGKPVFDDDDDDDDDLDDYPPEGYCRIPGCEQTVHVDADGEPSDYCSLRHRE
jgi:hypothetical protein